MPTYPNLPVPFPYETTDRHAPGMKGRGCIDPCLKFVRATRFGRFLVFQGNRSHSAICIAFSLTPIQNLALFLAF